MKLLQRLNVCHENWQIRFICKNLTKVLTIPKVSKMYKHGIWKILVLKNSNDSTENGVNPKKFQDNPDLAYYSYPIRKNCFIIISSRKKTEKKNNTKNFSLTFLSRGKQDLREVYNPLSMWLRETTPNFWMAAALNSWWSLRDEGKKLKKIHSEELPLVTSMCCVQ